ncbi:MAG: purine-nucleoside phosphorylase [Calditrichaeota bacterium]|nr:MAG: purine-nucleoside phosphorylase [Calditrichota bacterium]
MLKEKLSEALKYIETKTGDRPPLAITLGSGLGPFADQLENTVVIPTETIPNYPVSTVEGHAGKWIFGELAGKRLLAMKGRIHAYEGYPLAQVTFPVQLMAALGVKTLIVTNAAGGINRNFAPGDLMLITDHINLMLDNPLIGPNDETLGPRFPDMSQPYDSELQSLAETVALELGIKLQKGVLGALKGPTYETAAEVRMLRALGADAGTMSTVPEVIVAAYRGLRVLGISCITNLATGISTTKLSHEEVTEVADMVKNKFSSLIKEIVSRIA